MERGREGGREKEREADGRGERERWKGKERDKEIEERMKEKETQSRGTETDGRCSMLECVYKYQSGFVGPTSKSANLISVI